MNRIQTGGGIPEYIPPDDILDRVADLLGSTASGFVVPFGGDKEKAVFVCAGDGGGDDTGDGAGQARVLPVESIPVLVDTGLLPTEATITAEVIADMDRLFDCVNSDTPHLKKGKPYSTNLTNVSPHLKHFAKMKKFFATCEFVGCQSQPPSKQGWIWTLNGIEKLSPSSTGPSRKFVWHHKRKLWC
ncbi:unnamed protein product [Colias eurytheme]|nr:unnamed protein product [Colias eurytheme]